MAVQAVTEGDSNTAMGSRALRTNTTGCCNTAIGKSALEWNHGGGPGGTGVGGGFNTAVGYYTLASTVVSAGDNNTAIGAGALFSNQGFDNTASGTNALWGNGSGSHNTATGADALVFNQTGNLNTANGFQALNENIAGNNNTAIGAKALKKSLGTKNIAIGYQAGVSLVNGNNNIYIGNQGNGDEFQTIRIGTAQTQTFIAGIGTASVSDAAVMIDTTTGQLGIATSSARYKEDITPMGTRSEKVLDLRPVTFVYKGDGRAIPHYGLIAEEVATVLPELVTRTATGEVQTVKYQELIPMLLNELQRQRQEFQQTLQIQEQALQSQQHALQRQQQELADLRARVGQGRETVSLAR